MNRMQKPVPPPTSGSRSALRVGVIAGAVIGLAAMASRLTSSANLSMLGSIMVVVGLGLAGFYGVRGSGDFSPRAAARTGAVAGLIAGLVTSVLVMGASLVQALDPSMQREVVDRTDALMKQAYSPEDLATLRDNGFTIEAIYPLAVAFSLVCCGALLPLAGMMLGAIGGTYAARMGRAGAGQ